MNAFPGSDHSRTSGKDGFATTHWSAVLSARDPATSTAGREAMAELCQTYWPPLYAYIRRRGHGSAEAEDLTQSFFARLLEKNFLGDLTPGLGRFRSFLLAALKHFLANEWDAAQAQKRGGGRVIISLDAHDLEERAAFEPPDTATPETIFERRWALTLLQEVLGRLRAESVAGKKAELFDALKPFLLDEPTAGAYTEVGKRLGLKPCAVKVAVHRLRRRYGELLRAQIARTLADPRDVEDELRHLMAALSSKAE